MTSNQQHALDLAEAILLGTVDPAGLNDEQWALLLMAADLNSSSAPPLRVARWARRQGRQHTGYFALVSTTGGGTEAVVEGPGYA